ncbi:RNA polymerase sigma factor [Miniphocaeibacter massiliensis]|uniref:RNA polymerase sigma factor n=1 Tax=Miniphocaeibacter massiliensis TaxID=2041841 RepID=UPI000C1BC784|nr:DUF1492 domain-containing protein [Miniphocaeibacter massiliensis]
MFANIEIEKRKDILRGFNYLEEEIRRKESRLQYLERRIEDLKVPRAIRLRDMPKDNDYRMFDDYIDSYLDEINELINFIKTSKETKRKIEKAIDSIDDCDMKRLLKLKYIDGMTIREIAEKLYLSERTIKRKHRLAIGQLDEQLLEVVN